MAATSHISNLMHGPIVVEDGGYNSISGSKDHPIIVREMQFHGGNSNPILVDENILVLKGRNKNCPIVVDDNNYEGFVDVGEGFIDDVGEGFVDGKHNLRSISKRTPSSRKKRHIGLVDLERDGLYNGIYCSICMEKKSKYERFKMIGCSHVYCDSCISQYVAAKLEDNVVHIQCPDLGCQTGFLEPLMCRSILTKEVFDLWGKALCESMVTDSSRLYCPFKDCSALLINDSAANEQIITDSKCPHCHRVFCAQCKDAWHDGFTCEAYQKLGLNERTREDLMLMQVANNLKWQRCPKCKFYVERISGCTFMLCRCGFRFCYGCATEMQGSSHHCNKCNRTW